MRIGDLLSRSDSGLGRLARRAEAAMDLAEALRACLPDGLGAELRAASLRDDGTLVVLASSPAWAARLRFESGTLLSRCREHHPAARTVEVRVAGPPPAPELSTRR